MARFDFGAVAGAGPSIGGMLGGPWGALAGGLLAGFAGGPRLPPELQKLYKFQFGIADQMRRFAQSVPLSDPNEQAALATARAGLGREQLASRNDLYNQLMPANGGGYQNMGDFATSLAAQESGARASLDMTHLLDATRARRQEMLNAAQVAQGAVGAASQPREDPSAGIAQAFAELSRSMARGQAQNVKKKPPPPPAGTGVAPGFKPGTAPLWRDPVSGHPISTFSWGGQPNGPGGSITPSIPDYTQYQPGAVNW